MPLRARRRARHFDVPVHDMTLRITGSDELYEEARAVGMQFWEQLQSYVIRNPDFQTSKRPLAVKGDAPAIVQVMATLAARAGVGPMFTFQGALTQSVGMALSRTMPEVTVACGPDHYIVTRKRARLALDGRLGSCRFSLAGSPDGARGAASERLLEQVLAAYRPHVMCSLLLAYRSDPL